MKMVIAMSDLEKLACELGDWQILNNMPPICAKELIDAPFVNEDQKNYLRLFIIRWDLAELES